MTALSTAASCCPVPYVCGAQVQILHTDGW